MKTKYIIKFLVLVLIGGSITLTSCTDWLDVNTNPYAASEQANINPGYLFNYAATTHSSNRQGGDFGIPLMISVQTVADGGFVSLGGWWSESMYDISTFSTGNAWVTAYASVGTNLVKSIMFSERIENNNAIAQAKILQAQVFYETTMIFGDIPFSEALMIEEYKTPVFDNQKDVLDGIIALLDDAIELIDESEPGISDYDIFYKGDMTKWLKLANSMKLRTLLVMVNKDQSKLADIESLIAEEDFIGAEDEGFIFPFFEAAGTQNPIFRINDRWASSPDYYMFFAHSSVVDLMKPNDDPRMPIYFMPGVDGEFNGILTSQDVDSNEDDEYITSAINYFDVWPADAPDVMFSYSEMCFMLAEIYARGIGVTQDITEADSYFRNGVEASLLRWGVSEADITTFINDLPDLSSITLDEALEEIYGQTWIDYMTRPFEAWVLQRRTNFPNLSVPELAPYSSLISRWVYPDRERQVNPNVPTPLPTITEKMWFQE